MSQNKSNHWGEALLYICVVAPLVHLTVSAIFYALINI